MAYLGNNPTTQSFISGTDYFSGTGSQTAFTLTRTVNSVNDIEVTINNVVQQPNSYTVSGTTLTISAAPSSGTSNVYVRYLSTTLQSITVPANSITRNKLDSDLQAGFQGRNRIINGHMVIDQRNAGASVSGGTSAPFCVDRWTLYGTSDSKYTGQQSTTAPAGFSNSMVLTSSAATSLGASDRYVIWTKPEGYNVADLNWGTANAKTVTLSFQVRSSLTGTFGGAIVSTAGDRSYPFTYTISSANTWTQASITIAGCTDGTWNTTNGIGMYVQISLGAGSTFSGTAGAWASANLSSATGATSVVGTSGATFYITGVQLEEGTTATSFERESYSVILQKCQRYYWKTNGTGGSSYPAVGAGGFLSTTSFSAFIPYPVQMRTTPTFSIGTALFIATSGYPSITALSQNYSNQYSARIEFTTTTAVAGYGGALGLDNVTTSFIAASAEL